METPDMKLSVVITACNDDLELRRTIASIRLTAGRDVPITVVDDCSGNPVSFIVPKEELEGVKLITNKQRLGVGPSRHVGVINSESEWVLICDSHMRFPNGWYELALVALQDSKVCYCGTMLGLDANHMDLDRPKQVYHGGTLNLYGTDQNDPNGGMQVMEAVWAKPSDSVEILLPLGASYFVHRETFLRLDPLSRLKGWGSDEVMIGLKWHLSGGSVRLLRNVRIGHVYTEQKNKRFRVPLGQPTYNKILAIHTLLPHGISERLYPLLKEITPAQEWAEAARMAKEHTASFMEEWGNNQRLFKVPFVDLCARFGLVSDLIAGLA